MAAPGATVELSGEPEEAAREGGAGAAWLDDLEARAAAVARNMTATAQGGPHVGLLAALVFLRLAEEHGLERSGTIASLADGAEPGTRLIALLGDAAKRYGVAGLDVFESTTGFRAGARRSTSAPLVDDRALRDLLLRLYPAEPPRPFARLAPDTLGRLYERSLAQSAQGTARGGARKTHGVFYTPSRVVDYVVERTLGRVLDGKSSTEAARVHVLDPACGSGAFLLGAYRRLLDWHRAHLRENAAPRLTSARRKQILESSVFGVDLDPAAVDVAKLSLMAACFADSSEDEPHVGAEAPPRLDRNLRAGHSLVDTDWHASQGVVGAAPFAWREAFPEIFREGGFDVVIGNPPYLSFGGRHAVAISKELRRYYAEHYESGGWPTAHSLFLERSVKLLSRRFVSFVVPDQVGHLGGYRSAREIAQREAGLVEVRYWGERVFPGVTTPALTIVLDKEEKGTATRLVDRDGTARRAVFRAGEPWSDSSAAALLERLRRQSFSLGKLVGDCGIRTTSSREQVVAWPRSDGEIVPVLEGKLIGRYGCRPPEVGVRLDSPRALFVSRAERYRDATFVIRQTAAYPIVGPREHALYFRNSLLALFSPSDGLDVHYLVALLNSKLLRFVYAETVREAKQRAFPQVKVKALQSLPFRQVDLAIASEKRRHDAIVELAKRALATQKAALAANGTEEQHASLREFDAIDRDIDDCVYDLYELSTEERSTVEQLLARP